MRITELELINFGKFSDYKIDLKDGLNIIYGDNEAGKSTVALFIKLMLYGISSSRTKSGAISERTMIIPWDKPKASGRMRINISNRDIEIYREFSKRASGDIFTVRDSHTGEDYFIEPIKSEEVGEKLLNMSRLMYEKTLWIGQSDVCMKGKNDEITARLMNILDIGVDSDISVGDAMERLEKKELSLKAKTKRNAKGDLDILALERDELRQNLAEIKQKKIQRESDESTLRTLESEINKIDKKSEEINSFSKIGLAQEKIKRIERLDGCMRREMQIANTRMFQLFKHKIKEDTKDNIDNDHSKIDALEVSAYEQKRRLNECENISEKYIKNKKKKCIIALFAVALAIFLACIGFCFKLMYMAVGSLGVGLVFSFLSALFISADKKKINENNVQCDREKEKFLSIEGDIAKIEDRLNSALKELECTSYSDFKDKMSEYSECLAKIKVCRDIYNEELGNDDYTLLKKEADEIAQKLSEINVDNGERDLSGLSENDIKDMLLGLNHKREEVLSRLIKLKNKLMSDEDFLSLEADIRVREKEIDELTLKKEDELSAVRFAHECLEKAYETIKSDYTPMLNAATLDNLKAMSGDRCQKITIADDFSINLRDKDDSGDMKRAEFFSMGTYDQIYFALRLAISSLALDSDKKVLCIDDLLTSYDDTRAKKTVEMLKDMSQKSDIQILLFTCHARIKSDVKSEKCVNIVDL